MTLFERTVAKPKIWQKIIGGIGLLVIGLIGVAYVRAPQPGRAVITPDQQRPQRSFAVIDTGGRVVTSDQLRGKWLLIFFGQLSGMDFCSKAFFPISAALSQQGEPFQIVLPLFVSLDPTRDTPDNLATFSRTLLYRFMLTHAPLDNPTALPEQFSTLTVAGSPGQETLGPAKVLHLIDPLGREAAALPCTASGLEIHELLTTATAEAPPSAPAPAGGLP
jgi:protein SCO1